MVVAVVVMVVAALAAAVVVVDTGIRLQVSLLKPNIK